MNAQEQAMLDALNAARAARGVGALRGDERLAAAARAHSEDMAAHPGMVHYGSDGSDGGERMRRAGYAWTTWGEVVGWGFEGQIEPMVNWWLNSPEHARRILDADMVDAGIGYATGLGPWGHYWTVNLARGDSGGYSEYYIPAVYAGGW